MSDIAGCLQQLLADVVGMYHKAHGYHWNVTGAGFQQFHQFLGSLYEDVYGSVDTIAENIRKRDAFPQFTVQSLASQTKVGTKDAGTGPLAQIEDLQKANDTVLADLQQSFDCAVKINDQGLANFLAERLDVHRKWRWQMSAMTGVSKSMSDAFGVEKALANNPRGLLTLLRYTGGKTARLGGAGRNGAELGNRLSAGNAVRARVTGTPKAIAAPVYHLPSEVAVRPRAGAIVSPGVTKPGEVATITSAAKPAAPKKDYRRLKFAAGTAGLAAAGGGAVLGADAINDRRKSRKAKRVHLGG